MNRFIDKTLLLLFGFIVLSLFLKYTEEINDAIIRLLKCCWLYFFVCFFCFISLMMLLFLMINNFKKWIKCDSIYCRILIILIGLILCISNVFQANNICFYCLVLYFIIYCICSCFSSKEAEYKLSFNKEKDLLYRSRLFNGTPMQIRKLSYRSKQGVTIAICGQWGSGKTFFLKDLLFELSKLASPKDIEEQECVWGGKYIICDKIELWEATSTGDVWKRVIHALYMGIYRRPPLDISFLSNIIISILSYFYAPAKVLGDIIELVRPDYKLRKIDSLNKALIDKKVILVFDDFERADFKIIQAVLPLFERLKQIPNLVVICAVAENELMHVFSSNGQNPESAAGYLTKLFDLKIEMPTITYTAVRNYLDFSLGDKYKGCDILKSFIKTYPMYFDSARQMIRVVDKLANIERQYFAGCLYRFSKNEHNEKGLDVLQRIKYIFLVESLRISNVKILDWLQAQIEPCDFIVNIPLPIIRISIRELFYDGDITNYDFNSKISYEQNKRKDWIEKNENLYRELSKKGNVWSVFSIIRADLSSNSSQKELGRIERALRSAYALSYTRCVIVEEWETIEIAQSQTYVGMRYADKINKYFESKNLTLEPSCISDAALSLLEFELEHKISQDCVKSLCESLEEEYKNRECAYSLCGNERFMGDYFMRLVKIWSVNDNNEICYQETREPLFLAFYKIMPLSGQAAVLSHAFSYYKNGFADEVESIKLLYKSDGFAKFIEKLCFEYGRKLACCISSYIKKDKELLTSEFRAYQFTDNECYLNQIKRGMALVIKECADIERLTCSWVNLMGAVYRTPLFEDNVVSTFVTDEVCQMMREVWKQVQERFIDFSRQGQIKILADCDETLKVLSEDFDQWEKCNRADKARYCMGTESLIKLVEEVKEYISAGSRLPA